MLLKPGIHRFVTCYPEFEHIPMAGFALVGRDAVALVDATIPASIDRDAAPYLRSIGLAATDIDWVVVTHGHPDHVGGLRQLVAANPDLRIVASAADRAWIEDQAQMWNDLFCKYPSNLAFDDSVRRYIVEDLGGWGAPVTEVVSPGHRIDLGGLAMTIEDASGHSAGHIAVYEESTGLLFTGDAVQGDGIDHVDVERRLPPLYEDYEKYVGSLERLQELHPSGVLSAHHPAAMHAAGIELLEQSRRFAERNAAIVLEIVRSRREPATLGSVAEELHSRLNALDRTSYVGPLQMLACSDAHLGSLARQQLVREAEPGLWTAP